MWLQNGTKRSKEDSGGAKERETGRPTGKVYLEPNLNYSLYRNFVCDYVQAANSRANSARPR